MLWATAVLIGVFVCFYQPSPTIGQPHKREGRPCRSHWECVSHICFPLLSRHSVKYCVNSTYLHGMIKENRYCSNDVNCYSGVCWRFACARDGSKPGVVGDHGRCRTNKDCESGLCVRGWCAPRSNRSGGYDAADGRSIEVTSGTTAAEIQTNIGVISTKVDTRSTSTIEPTIDFVSTASVQASIDVATEQQAELSTNKPTELTNHQESTSELTGDHSTTAMSTVTSTIPASSIPNSTASIDELLNDSPGSSDPTTASTPSFTRAKWEAAILYEIPVNPLSVQTSTHNANRASHGTTVHPMTFLLPLTMFFSVMCTS